MATCSLSLEGGMLVLSDAGRVLQPRQHSQLAVWGFGYNAVTSSFSRPDNGPALLAKVAAYLERSGVSVNLSEEAARAREGFLLQAAQLARALETGERFKNGNPLPSELRGFLEFINSLPRRLKPHQIKAALHLLAVRNGANFSVPGSGKTTVVLVAFEWLRRHNIVNTLFVVGPPSCFAPWVDEYRSVFGKPASTCVLAGGDVEERKRNYYPSSGEVRDLYLTSFQTLQRDFALVRALFSQQEVAAALAVDEAHYIKQVSGVWADAVLAVAPSAKARVVLTGTPFPQSLADAYNYFEVLWPGSSPITPEHKTRLAGYLQRGQEEEAGEMLHNCVGPLFYRVRKHELNLAPQDFRKPVVVRMRKHERRVYDSIVAKIREVAINDDYQEFELLTKLRRGRMMRLRQCLSYTKLLGTAVTHYDEDLTTNDLKLSATIKGYDNLEKPAKLEAALELVANLCKQGEKVVVWSNFVETLKMLKTGVETLNRRAELIYGGTPTEFADDSEELSREQIIAQFKDRNSGLDVLIANPAACAESISLHKTCSNAIYYDLSYNCAQYLQSLDRIHRVGGSEEKVSHYHFLQYEDTIDLDIFNAVRRKAASMSALIDRDCAVYSLDMFGDEDELDAYDRLFR